MNAYADLVDFMLREMTPEQILAFKPSAEAQERVSGLLHKQSSSHLDADEERELERFMELEHIIRMAKARARKYVESR